MEKGGYELIIDEIKQITFNVLFVLLNEEEEEELLVIFSLQLIHYNYLY